MNTLPLARYRAAGDPVLIGQPSTAGATLGTILAADFFVRAGQLAAALPDAAFVINLCETRAGFMLGFAAALMRGQISLLPAGQGRSDWEKLLGEYPGAYLLVDDAAIGNAASVGIKRFDLSAFTAPTTEVGVALQIPQIGDAQSAAILFTSGSTGQPSAHPKTWGQLCRGAAALAAALGWDDTPARAPAFSLVGSVPPQHMFGLEATVMLPWHAGVPVHSQRPLLAADLGAVLAQHPLPSWWMTTAMHMRAPLSAPAHLPGLQGVLASTMSVPVALAIAAECAWQVPIMEIYGSTETGALAIRRTASESTWLPLPGVSLWSETLVGNGADTETLCSWAAGPHVEPAVQLGDELQLLPDGRFLLGGRANDLVKVGGKRASLAALNQSLCEVAGVDEGIYFFPDEAGQAAANDEANTAQRPVVFYVSQTLSPQQVVGALRARIDPVFIPRPLYRVAQLPRNANGKLPRAALAELLAQCKAKRVIVPAAAAAVAATRAGVSPMMIPVGHPALPGHFPGEPIVPGVVILARVVEAIHARFPQLELGALLNARFHAPLKPARIFSVQLHLHNDQLRFEVHAGMGAEAADANASTNISTLPRNAPAANAALIASGQWAYSASRVADASTIGQG